MVDGYALSVRSHVQFQGRMTVRDKILDANTALGGVSRISFQMSSAMLETEAMQRSIELLGSEVAPTVKAALRQEKIRG